MIQLLSICMPSAELNHYKIYGVQEKRKKRKAHSIHVLFFINYRARLRTVKERFPCNALAKFSPRQLA